MEDNLEWSPDCDDEAYDEKLLWLSECLCCGDPGVDEFVSCDAFSAKKLDLETSVF